MSNPPYNILETTNGGQVLEIQAPGFNKHNLEALFDNSLLEIKGNLGTRENAKYLGIREDLYAVWKIPESLKIDLITCTDGIISILLSKKIDLPKKSNQIEIM